MEQEPELVVVFRSMDETAKEDCDSVVELLRAEGIVGSIADESAPGVPEGVFEVRVSAKDALQAEKIVEANTIPEQRENVDNSPGLDLETIFHSEGNITAEMEANAIRSVLEANGIAVVSIGDSVLPNFAFELKVAKEDAARARELVAEAERSGPAAADAAELESEREG
jgi:hypothetical protein